jgi:hypothetical protein
VGAFCQYARENRAEWVIMYCTTVSTVGYSTNAMDKKMQWAVRCWSRVSEMGYTPNIQERVNCVTMCRSRVVAVDYDILGYSGHDGYYSWRSGLYKYTVVPP